MTWQEQDNEDPNVANLTESKSQRGDASQRSTSEPRYAIDPAHFSNSHWPCVEPDPRSAERSLIRAENCLFSAFGRGLPPLGVPIVKILSEMQAALLAACSKIGLGCPEQDALKAAWDRWYESMVAVALWNANASFLNRRAGSWVWLPGSSELNFRDLLAPGARETAERLEQRLKSQGALLVISNPNFVYIAHDEEQLPPEFHRPIENYSPETHDLVMQSYRRHIGTCAPAQIGICLGLKSFSRAERSPCIPYEADILKTLYAHFKKRGLSKADALRYYAITSFEPSESDETGFSAATCRSILEEETATERAVDGLLYLQSLSEIADRLPPLFP